METILPVENPSAMAKVRQAIFGGEPIEMFNKLVNDIISSQPSHIIYGGNQNLHQYMQVQLQVMKGVPKNLSVNYMILDQQRGTEEVSDMIVKLNGRTIKTPHSWEVERYRGLVSRACSIWRYGYDPIDRKGNFL